MKVMSLAATSENATEWPRNEGFRGLWIGATELQCRSSDWQHDLSSAEVDVVLEGRTTDGE